MIDLCDMGHLEGRRIPSPFMLMKCGSPAELALPNSVLRLCTQKGAFKSGRGVRVLTQLGALLGMLTTSYF